MAEERKEQVIIPPWDLTKTTGAEMWEQKRRLASAMRLVIERLVPSNAPEKELRIAAEKLELYAAALKAHPRLKHFVGYGEAAPAGDVGAFFDQSPMIGLANPLAPPLMLGKAGERTAIGRVTFGSAYEGPPGGVHGGYIAAAFDEVLGYVQSLSEHPGMTGTLTIRYRRPTPLHTELNFEGELVRTEGRKIFTQARCLANGEVTAEGEGIFISIDRTKVRQMLAKRAEALARQTEEESGGG